MQTQKMMDSCLATDGDSMKVVGYDSTVTTDDEEWTKLVSVMKNGIMILRTTFFVKESI